jgi:outer membrane protein assembly factor BamB
MKRICIVVLILCACFLSVAWGQQPTCKVYTPWAEFHRHDMQRWNPCEKVLNVHNVRRVGLKWSGTAGSFVTSSPALANGAVYIGSTDHYVHALNASTGAKLGSYLTGNQVESPPSVANGVVYVGFFYEKVIKVKADVAALLNLFSDVSIDVRW